MSIVTHFLWFYRAFSRSLWMSMVVMVALATGLSAADGTGTGLAGSYFANETLSGTPTVTRTDAQVNFAWAGGAAAVGMPVDSFSVRWEGEIQPRYSESYTLIARTDDGVRIWLDGVLVVDAWKLRGAADSTYVFTAVAGQHYRIRMEYYEHFGAAVAKLQWQSAHEAKAAIPTSQLYPLPADMTGVGSGTGLLAAYFANETLSGTPVLNRTGARVDVDWAGGSPASGVPVDSFSARWDGEIQPRFTEVYTLIARTDDGVRVWLDNALVIDAWKLRGAADSTYTFTAQAGQRYRIRMEYFERSGSASARLWWQSASELRGPIPTSQLYPTAPNLTGIGTGTGLIAAYFPNENLSGTPALSRTDARVDFDWAGGSPGVGVPVDSFSARWDGEIQPRFSEVYTLTARTDDGVRVWLDNALESQ